MVNYSSALTVLSPPPLSHARVCTQFLSEAQIKNKLRSRKISDTLYSNFAPNPIPFRKITSRRKMSVHFAPRRYLRGSLSGARIWQRIKLLRFTIPGAYPRACLPRPWLHSTPFIRFSHRSFVWTDRICWITRGVCASLSKPTAEKRHPANDITYISATALPV